MKPKYWLLFALWQTIGSIIGLLAHHVDRLSWAISDLMLMPGTIVMLYVFRPGGIGNDWPKWTIFATSVSVNLAAFATIVMIRRSRRVQS